MTGAPAAVQDRMGEHNVRTDQLIVIAGPPCAGKTTLIARIREGALPVLGEQLGLGEPAAWAFVDATELGRMSQAFTERLVVHYDLIVQRSPQGFRYLPDIIRDAQRVVFLTVWTGAETLQQRSRERLRGAVSSLVRHAVAPQGRVKRLRNLWRRHCIFRDAARVDQLYRDWFGFAAGYPETPHWIIDPSMNEVAARAFEGTPGSLPTHLRA